MTPGSRKYPGFPSRSTLLALDAWEWVPPWGEGGETGSSGLKGEACPGVPWQRSPAAHTAGLRHVFPSPLDGSQHRSLP